MALHVCSDGSHPYVTKSSIRVVGVFFLSRNTSEPHKSIRNISVRVLSSILKNVMASSTETENASTLENTQEAVPMRNALNFLEHL